MAKWSSLKYKTPDKTFQGSGQIEGQGAQKGMSDTKAKNERMHRVGGRTLCKCVNFVWNCHREREQSHISQGFMPGGAAAMLDVFENRWICSRVAQRDAFSAQVAS
jgi:hypothetical protein